MGAADHGAVPGRPPGRRAGRLPAGPQRCWPTSSASTRDRSCASWSSRSSTTTSRSTSPAATTARPTTRPAGNLPSMSAELVGRDVELADARRPALHAAGWSRSSARAGSARPPWPSPPAAPCAPPGGVWLARLEMATTRRRRRRHRDRRVARDRRRGRARRTAPAAPTPSSSSTTASTSSTPPPSSPSACSTRARRCACCARARCRSTSTVRPSSSSPRSRSTTPSSCSAAGPPPSAPAGTTATTDGACTTCAARSTGCRWRSSSPRPAPGRCPSRRSPGASTTASTCCSDPTSRKPERRRALGATIRWSYDLLFPDDQRGLWALATFAGGAPLAAVEYVLDALGVPAPAAVDVVGRLASRSLVIVDDDDSSGQPSLPAARQHPGIRPRRDGRGRTRRHRARRPRRAGSPTPPRRRPSGVRSSRQADHLAFARTERANIDAALAWSADQRPAAARCDIVNGFGWAWVVLGDSRGAQRVADRARRRRRRRPAGDRATALLLASWLEASTGDLELGPPAHRRRRGARRRHRRRRPARPLPLLPRLRRVPRRRVRAGDGAHRPQRRASTTSSDRPWDQAANALFAARAAISAGDEARAVDALRAGPALARRRSTTRGCTCAATPCSASWPDCSTGSTTPSTTSPGRPRPRADAATCRPRRTRSPASAAPSARPATTPPARPPCDWRSTRPRRPATCAWPRSPASTSDACCVRSATTPEHVPALEAAAAWHRDAGGGEQARLGECLLAAIDAADGVAGRRRAARRHPRRRPSRRRGTRRGLRPRRPRSARAADRRHDHRRRLCRRERIGAWRPPPTSSPSATAPTRAW